MRVCGIIAEYDPFHKGHLYQLNEAKKRSQSDYLICVISTAFTQRGWPALFSTHDRALMALCCGADLVLGMPAAYSCAQANRFALGGIGILRALGPVTHLSFGVEENTLPYLKEAAHLLQQPTSAFKESFEAALARGESPARAQGAALAAALGAQAGSELDKPNFNLGIAYIDALNRLGSPMEIVPVIRQGSYHDTKAGPFPSATAMRGAILRGAWSLVRGGLPDESRKVAESCVLEGRIHLPEALDSLLLARLQSGEDFSGIDEMTEGLDRRIIKYAPQAASRSQLIELVKTKRYPYARISRALAHCLLGIEKQAARPPQYARLLGMRKSAAPLLKEIDRGDFPLISRPARESLPGIALDMRAEELWYIGAKQPAASAWRNRVIII